jgi:hypothetical protein
MVFESKIDAWLAAVCFVPMLFVVALLAAGAYARPASGPELTKALLVLIPVNAFLVWMFRATDYRIAGDTLLIRSAIFRWKVPVADIQSVTPTRNPLSSPALSLDRLEIKHSRGEVLVSPKDKQGFISALRAANPSISFAR